MAARLKLKTNLTVRIGVCDSVFRLLFYENFNSNQRLQISHANLNPELTALAELTSTWTTGLLTILSAKVWTRSTFLRINLRKEVLKSKTVDLELTSTLQGNCLALSMQRPAV